MLRQPTQRLQQCPLDDVSAYDTVWCTLFTNSAPCVLTLDAPLHAAHFAKKRCLHLTRLCMVRALPKKELTHSKCTRCAPLNTQLRYHMSESSRPFCSCGGHGYLFFRRCSICCGSAAQLAAWKPFGKPWWWKWNQFMIRHNSSVFSVSYFILTLIFQFQIICKKHVVNPRSECKKSRPCKRNQPGQVFKEPHSK